LTWAWVFNLTSTVQSYSHESGGPSNITLFLVVFFQPLQGFFNAMIFMYQKVHTLRLSRNHLRTRLSFFAAFKHVIVSPQTVPQAVVSSIEIATEDIEVRRPEGGAQMHVQVRQLRPGQLTNEEREEIAEISRMRRVGYNPHLNEATPPPSISSGAGSSFISGEFSIGHLSSINDDENHYDNDKDDNNGYENRNGNNGNGDHEYDCNQNTSGREEDADAYA